MSKFNEYLEAAQEDPKAGKLDITGKFPEALYMALSQAKPSGHPDKKGSISKAAIAKAAQDLKECGVALVYDTEGVQKTPKWSKFTGYSNFYEYHYYETFIAIATKKPISFKAKYLTDCSIKDIKAVLRELD